MRIGIDVQILMGMMSKSHRMSGRDIANAIGKNPGTVYRRLKVLVAEKWVVEESGYGCNKKYYHIADDREQVIREFRQIINTTDCIDDAKRKR